MNVRSRQEGMTLLGWIIVLAVIGVFVLTALRLIPIYLNNVKLVSVIDGVKSDLDGQQPNKSLISNTIAKRYNVEGITFPEFDQIIVKKSGQGYTVSADYEQRAPFFGNIEFVVSFSKSVEVTR